MECLTANAAAEARDWENCTQKRQNLPERGCVEGLEGPDSLTPPPPRKQRNRLAAWGRAGRGRSAAGAEVVRRRTGMVRRIVGASAGRRVLGVNKVALLVCFALSQVAWGQNTPGKPTITALVPKGGCFTVRWSAPDSDGGSAITGYDVTQTNVTTLIKEVGADVRETQWPNTCNLNTALTYNMAVRGPRTRTATGTGRTPWT